ncbi:MAG: hypothetical protein JO061_07350 [Acidobacteriaceae bacterium]|nr:hypothetical protein [Acidobacteriaceae bacterium]
MRWSSSFIPTLREPPAEAETAGHALLLRAGYIRQLDPGAYAHLPLAQRSLLRIRTIVRQELERDGAQEFGLPSAAPARAIEALARNEIRSYRQLPQIWHGVRGSNVETIAFSIDGAPDTGDAFARAFDALELRCLRADASANSREFIFLSSSGHEDVVRCSECGYAAKLEFAQSRSAESTTPDPEGDLKPELFHTPAIKTIAQLSAFTGTPDTAQMKSLVLVVDETPLLLLVRGDHQVSEKKLRVVTGCTEVRAAEPAEIVKWFGASPGSLGPIGLQNVRVLADNELLGRRNMMTGANRDDYHLRNVTPGEDFHPEYADIRRAAEGDHCTVCNAPLQFIEGLQIARTRTVDTAVRVLTEDGEPVAPRAVSSELDVGLTLVALAETFADRDGLALPATVAPFTAVITPANYNDGLQRESADLLYSRFISAGIDTLLDDRDERPGVKFKDADLIGIPYRITIGKKLAEGKVELFDRRRCSSSDVLLHETVTALQLAASSA